MIHDFHDECSLLSPVPLRRDDRRKMLRYGSVVRRAWLGWKGEEAFRSAPTILLDVSMGGCLLGLRVQPPSDQPLVIRLDGELLPVWYEAKLLAAERYRRRAWLARVTFPDGCPYAFFMAAAFGQVSRQFASEHPRLERFFGEDVAPH